MHELIYSILEEITGEDLREEGNVNLFDNGIFEYLQTLSNCKM